MVSNSTLKNIKGPQNRESDHGVLDKLRPNQICMITLAEQNRLEKLGGSVMDGGLKASVQDGEHSNSCCLSQDHDLRAASGKIIPFMHMRIVDNIVAYMHRFFTNPAFVCMHGTRFIL